MITTKIENKNKNNFKMIMENFRNWSDKTPQEVAEEEIIQLSNKFLCKKFGFGKNRELFEQWAVHSINDYGRLILNIEAVDYIKDTELAEKSSFHRRFLEVCCLRNEILLNNVPDSVNSLAEGLKLKSPLLLEGPEAFAKPVVSKIVQAVGGAVGKGAPKAASSTATATFGRAARGAIDDITAHINANGYDDAVMGIVKQANQIIVKNSGTRNLTKAEQAIVKQANTILKNAGRSHDVKSAAGTLLGRIGKEGATKLNKLKDLQRLAAPGANRATKAAANAAEKTVRASAKAGIGIPTQVANALGDMTVKKMVLDAAVQVLSRTSGAVVNGLLTKTGLKAMAKAWGKLDLTGKAGVAVLAQGAMTVPIYLALRKDNTKLPPLGPSLGGAEGSGPKGPVSNDQGMIAQIQTNGGVPGMPSLENYLAAEGVDLGTLSAETFPPYLAAYLEEAGIDTAKFLSALKSGDQGLNQMIQNILDTILGGRAPSAGPAASPQAGAASGAGPAASPQAGAASGAGPAASPQAGAASGSGSASSSQAGGARGRSYYQRKAKIQRRLISQLNASGRLMQEETTEDSITLRKIQNVLKGLGYNLGTFGPNKDGVDGKYGQSTHDAIVKFQTDYPETRPKGEKPDGLIGPNTFPVLFRKGSKDGTISSRAQKKNAAVKGRKVADAAEGAYTNREKATSSFVKSMQQWIERAAEGNGLIRGHRNFIEANRDVMSGIELKNSAGFWTAYLTADKKRLKKIIDPNKHELFSRVMGNFSPKKLKKKYPQLEKLSNKFSAAMAKYQDASDAQSAASEPANIARRMRDQQGADSKELEKTSKNPPRMAIKLADLKGLMIFFMEKQQMIPGKKERAGQPVKIGEVGKHAKGTRRDPDADRKGAKELYLGGFIKKYGIPGKTFEPQAQGKTSEKMKNMCIKIHKIIVKKLKITDADLNKFDGNRSNEKAIDGYGDGEK